MTEQTVEEIKLPRYRTVPRCPHWSNDHSLDGYLERINALSEVGYKVHTYTSEYALMEIKDDYHGVTNLKDIPPNEVDDFIVNGWTIASASISTKFVRMVKR